MESIEEIREKISSVDSDMAKLFNKRLDLSREIAKSKQKNNVSIADYKRESVVETNFAKNVSAEFTGQARALSRTLMAISKMVQRDELYDDNKAINFPNSTECKKENLKVAYQGVNGAWSAVAATKIFKNADISGYDYFDDVFINVANGKIDYGVLPIENSKSGAIGEVYDLLSQYGCYIVGQTWCDINHCIMSKAGVDLKKVRKVYSHPEGFKQCNKFLQKYNFDLIATTNTAVAANIVANETSNESAAIASSMAAKINNLVILDSDIITDKTNKTRFIVIANKPYYSEKSDHISVSFKTLDKSGALCDVLFQFMSNGVNLSRIESRPSSNGEYTFFADLQGNIGDVAVQNALTCAIGSCVYLEIHGCYSEI